MAEFGDMNDMPEGFFYGDGGTPDEAGIYEDQPFEEVDIVPEAVSLPDDTAEVQPVEMPILVDWDSGVLVGKVEGSEWVRPAPSAPLKDIYNMTSTVTDDDLRVFADGTDQHLALYEFGGGFHSCQVVDSHTGEILTGSGVSSRSTGMVNGSATVYGSALLRPVALGDGKVIESVDAYQDGTETRVGLEYLPDHPHRNFRRHTLMRINPGERDVALQVLMPLSEIGGAAALFEAKQRQDRFSGRFFVDQISTVREAGHIDIRFDETGTLQDLIVKKGGFVDLLGIVPDAQTDMQGGRSGREGDDVWAITDPVARQHIADSLMQVLGFGGWTQLDVRRTAADMYAGMGRPDFDITTALAFRSASA